jgi:hypothetical protein
MLPASYEAESAVLDHGARVDTLPAASGGLAVFGIGRPNQGTLRFVGIAAPATGRYRLTIYYHSPKLTIENAEISVNGGRPLLFTFERTGTCCILTAMILVDLVAGGRNCILFANPNGPGPAIDRIVVSRPPG